MEFSILICDEAHVAKSLDTIHFMTLVALANVSDRIIFSSATPMLNKPHDILAYLCVAFQHVPRVEAPRSYPLERFYLDDFDPDEPIGTTVWKNPANGQVVGPNAMPGPTQDEYPNVEARDLFRQGVEEGENLVIFSPALYHDTAKQYRYSFDHCSTCVQPILRTAFINMDIFSTIDMPGGEKWSPSDNIPMCHITTVLLENTGPGVKEQQVWLDRLLPLMYRKKFHGSANDEDDDEPTRINGGIVRKLDLLSLDPACVPILQLDEWWAVHQARRGKDTEQDADPPVMGVRDVNDMIHAFADGGASHLMEQMRRDDTVPLPEDRLSILLFLVSQSPLKAAALLDALEIYRDCRKEGEPFRLLVFVDSPITQQ